MKPLSLTDRLDLLSRKGVDLIDPRQTFVDDTVRLDRIFPGSVLFPGTRLLGPSTLVAPGAKVGSEGPATIVDSAIERLCTANQSKNRFKWPCPGRHLIRGRGVYSPRCRPQANYPDEFCNAGLFDQLLRLSNFGWPLSHKSHGSG